jgi:hypothetical protein
MPCPYDCDVKIARLKSRQPLSFDPALRELRMNRAAARFTKSKAAGNSTASATATAHQQLRLPSSAKLNRPLQIQMQGQMRRAGETPALRRQIQRRQQRQRQRRPPEGGRYKCNGNGNAMLLWKNPPAQPEGCATQTGLGDAASEERSFASLRMTA